MDETIDAPVAETPDAKLANITATVEKLERQRDRYKNLVEEACLDGIAATLKRFGCSMRLLPDGRLNVFVVEGE